MTDSNTGRQEVATRLRMAREQAGLSQGQVAKLFGFQRPTISEIEAGRRKVSVEELSQFGKIYDVSIEWLTKATDQMPNPAVELAARELARLKQEDLDTVLNLLKTLRAEKK